jgi:outer membrane protein assembly factor BamB
VSPVIVGDRLIVQLTVATNAAAWHAIRKQDGAVLWSHPVEQRRVEFKTADRAYAPAVPCTLNGKPLLLLISNAGIDGVDVTDGKRVWTHSLADLQMNYGPFPEPVFFAPDKFFLGLWYSLKGTAMVFQMTPEGLTRVWSENTIGKGAYSYVIRNGRVYGYGATGLLCVDLERGKTLWRWRSDDPAVAKDQGEVILVGDKLVWISSSGMLYVGEASPEKRGPIAEFKAVAPCTKPLAKDQARYNNVISTSPTFAAGRVYCRSGWGEAVCVDFGTPARP